MKNQENNNIKKINNSEEYSKDMLKGKLSKNLNKINISNKKFKSKLRNIHDKKKISVKNKNNLIQKKINKEAIIKLSRTDYDLQDIDYEEAIIYDKRSYLRMFWGFLLDSQIILGTFCTENHLDLFVINPLASPCAGAPALKYGYVNTVTPSPGEAKGLTNPHIIFRKSE